MKKDHLNGLSLVKVLNLKSISSFLTKKIFFLGGSTITVICLFLMIQSVKGQTIRKPSDIYFKDNLVAWCIVPFDSKERDPEERAEMLNELGITKLAYDWRVKHIPSFDEELNALNKHKIKLQAFWLPTGPDPAHDPNIKLILELLKRHHEKTELWVMVTGIPGLDTMTQEEKVIAVSKPVAYLAEKAAEIGCKIGLYNHGGWFGEPENQLAIIDYLKMPNIGMVYNFSHSETQIQQFDDFFPKILPHLLSINITGLINSYPATVVPVGTGNMEMELIQEIHKSGYNGPIGIINENFAKDAKVGLEMNMNGLKHILREIGDTAALKTYH